MGTCYRLALNNDHKRRMGRYPQKATHSRIRLASNCIRPAKAPSPAQPEHALLASQPDTSVIDSTLAMISSLQLRDSIESALHCSAVHGVTHHGVKHHPCSAHHEGKRTLTSLQSRIVNGS